MSDLPPGSAPPPPFDEPPPPYQPPLAYPGPPAPGPAPAGYQASPAYPGAAPGQMPPPIVPMAAAASGFNLMYQFGGNAGWSVLLGIVSIIVPFVFNRVFFFLPILGLIAAVRAIQRGRMIGGITGIVVNVIGGIITIIGLFG